MQRKPGDKVPTDPEKSVHRAVGSNCLDRQPTPGWELLIHQPPHYLEGNLEVVGMHVHTSSIVSTGGGSQSSLLVTAAGLAAGRVTHGAPLIR